MSNKMKYYVEWQVPDGEEWKITEKYFYNKKQAIDFTKKLIQKDPANGIRLSSQEYFINKHDLEEIIDDTDRIIMDCTGEDYQKLLKGEII